jgi:hypothetical protein
VRTGDSSRSFLNLNEKRGKLGDRYARCTELGPVKPALPLCELGVGWPMRFGYRAATFVSVLPDLLCVCRWLLR